MMSAFFSTTLLVGFFAFITKTITSSDYTAVVLDSVTRQPVEFAIIEIFENSGSTSSISSNKSGLFHLIGSPVHIKVSRLGYSSLELIRNSKKNEIIDTIYLVSQSHTLQNVVVRPGNAIVLSTIDYKAKQIGYGVLPGQAIAMLVKPETNAVSEYIQLLNLRLFLQNKPKQGNLRVRLLNVLTDPDSTKLSRPGTSDLLPSPLVYTFSQLADLPKKNLVIDLSPYNLTVPPEGVYIEVECLSNSSDAYLDSIKKIPNDKKITVTTTNTNGDTRSTRLSIHDYPFLQAQYPVASSNTWYKLKKGSNWEKRNSVTNVRAELDVIVN